MQTLAYQIGTMGQIRTCRISEGSTVRRGNARDDR
jgi:hypothetical protein